MELKDLRPNEQEKYATAKDFIDLGCTDTAIRRGRERPSLRFSELIGA